jgi:hypothetical protein
MEETGVPGENHRPVTNHRQTLSHNVVLLAIPKRSRPRRSPFEAHYLNLIKKNNKIKSGFLLNS